MPPRKIQPSKDLDAAAQVAACPPGIAGAVIVGLAVIGVVAAGVEADTVVEFGAPAIDAGDADDDVGCGTGSAVTVLSIA